MTKMEALSGVSSRGVYCKFWGIPYEEVDNYEAAESPAYKGAAVGGIRVHVAETSLWQQRSAPPAAFQALAATYCWLKDAPVSIRSCTAALDGRRLRG